MIHKVKDGLPRVDERVLWFGPNGTTAFGSVGFCNPGIYESWARVSDLVAAATTAIAIKDAFKHVDFECKEPVFREKLLDSIRVTLINLGIYKPGIRVADLPARMKQQEDGSYVLRLSKAEFEGLKS